MGDRLRKLSEAEAMEFIRRQTGFKTCEHLEGFGLLKQPDGAIYFLESETWEGEVLSDKLLCAPCGHAIEDQYEPIRLFSLSQIMRDGY